MSWLIKRLFTDKNLDYLIEKTRPRIKEEILEISKEAIDDLLTDREFMERLTQIGDAYYTRYSHKLFSGLGGTQKGINAGTESLIPDIFTKDGDISASKGLRFLLSGGLKQLNLGGNKAQNNPQAGEEGQNAPTM